MINSDLLLLPGLLALAAADLDGSALSSGLVPSALLKDQVYAPAIFLSSTFSSAESFSSSGLENLSFGI